MKSARHLVLQRQAIARSKYYAQVSQGLVAEDSQAHLTGEAVGFDADSGRRLVRLRAGGTIATTDITSGAIATGSQMSVSLSRSEAYSDAMPS